MDQIQRAGIVYMSTAQLSESSTVLSDADQSASRSASSLEHPINLPLIRVQNLDVEVMGKEAKPVCVLDGISLEIQKGQAIGILGESGSGKTTLARSLLRLLPGNFRIAGGTIDCEGADILRMGSKELTRLRGKAVSLIHQEAAGALHPTMRIGRQVMEIVKAHHRWSRKKCLEEARATLAKVFREDLDRIFNSYPHELSGGQRQRVLIAQAISCRPSLIIADEPTASLDLTTQAEIIQLLKDLKRQLGMALLLITHNPSLLPRLVDRVLVMYDGQIVEEGPLEKVFASPLHPYTQDLMRLRPSAAQARSLSSRRKLPVIENHVGDASGAELGCHFEKRCSQRISKCASVMPEEKYIEESRRVRCFLYEN
jgi:peptide/nickel transport system ATP-binding protein